MGDGMPAGPVNVAVRETGIRARWRHHRATRPHGTVRVSLLLTHLRLYAPVMKLLHRWGQCFMTTHRAPDGTYRRKCTWCGHSYRLRDPAAAEASLRAAVRETCDG